jgi:hypothetical protein
MASVVRIHVPSGGWHGTSRGNGGETICRTDEDRVLGAGLSVGFVCSGAELCSRPFTSAVEVPCAHHSKGPPPDVGGYGLGLHVNEAAVVVYPAADLGGDRMGPPRYLGGYASDAPGVGFLYGRVPALP